MSTTNFLDVNLRSLSIGGQSMFSPAPLASRRRSFVATRSLNSNLLGVTPNVQMSAASAHFARDTIKSVEVVFPHYYVDSNGDRAEKGPGANGTITASIEYPLGTFTQLKDVSGSATATLPNGGVVSMYANVAIPRGALFRIRTWRNCANFLPYISSTQAVSPQLGECGVVGATVADNTVNGAAYVSPNFFFCYYPVAIIGETRLRTLAIIGDSIEFGQGDAPNGFGDVGFFAKALGAGMAYTKVAGAPNTRITDLLAGYTQGLAIAQYASDIAFGQGINDIVSGSRTAQNVIDDTAAVAALFPGKNLYLRTLPPGGVTSSDSFATFANQTVAGTKTIQDTVNTSRLTVPSPWKQCFDVSTAVSGQQDGRYTRNSGKWITARGGAIAKYSTDDGTHPEVFAYDRGAAVIASQYA